MEAYAVSVGGHLVTVNDAAEQAFLISTFTRNDLWLGLNDIAVEGALQWASGEALTYQNFAPGEPNGGTAENAIVKWNDPAGLWNDVPQSWELFGTVETVPDGGASVLLLMLALGSLIVAGKQWRPYRELNPSYRRERAVS